jgi:hypothetical protein
MSYLLNGWNVAAFSEDLVAGATNGIAIAPPLNIRTLQY